MSKKQTLKDVVALIIFLAPFVYITVGLPLCIFLEWSDFIFIMIFNFFAFTYLIFSWWVVDEVDKIKTEEKWFWNELIKRSWYLLSVPFYFYFLELSKNNFLKPRILKLTSLMYLKLAQITFCLAYIIFISGSILAILYNYKFGILVILLFGIMIYYSEYIAVLKIIADKDLISLQEYIHWNKPFGLWSYLDKIISLEKGLKNLSN